MSRAVGERFDRGPWRFLIPEGGADRSAISQEHLQENLIDAVIATVAGQRGAPFRRSRHATTWRMEVTSANGARFRIFVKQLDSARGWLARIKSQSRVRRVEHVVQISDDLRRDGFGVPRILLSGENLDTGNELIVTTEVAGFMVTRWMNPAQATGMRDRRAIFIKLGEEIARLHRDGYIHGDLTPYNIFVTHGDGLSITFIDHERTWKTTRLSINLARERLRNLVQLGHFEVPGVSRADKLRVFNSYSEAYGWSKFARHRSLRRLLKMIKRRLEKDRAITRIETPASIVVEERRAQG
jgi:serine/threonine protein kinase